MILPNKKNTILFLSYLVLGLILGLILCIYSPKWVFVIYVTIFTVCLVWGIYLVFTNKLDKLKHIKDRSFSQYKKVEKWLLGGTLASILVLGYFISFTYDMFKADYSKKTFLKTDQILKTQVVTTNIAIRTYEQTQEINDKTDKGLQNDEQVIKELQKLADHINQKDIDRQRIKKYHIITALFSRIH